MEQNIELWKYLVAVFALLLSVSLNAYYGSKVNKLKTKIKVLESQLNNK